MKMTDNQKSFLEKVAYRTVTRPLNWSPMYWLDKTAGREEIEKWLKSPLSNHPDYSNVFQYTDMFATYTFTPNSIWRKVVRSKF